MGKSDKPKLANAAPNLDHSNGSQRSPIARSFGIPQKGNPPTSSTMAPSKDRFMSPHLYRNFFCSSVPMSYCCNICQSFITPSSIAACGSTGSQFHSGCRIRTLQAHDRLPTEQPLFGTAGRLSGDTTVWRNTPSRTPHTFAFSYRSVRDSNPQADMAVLPVSPRSFVGHAPNRSAPNEY